MKKFPERRDRVILGSLQKNCKRSLREIARELHAPISTVHEKIKRYERDGVVKAYRAVLDDRKLGFAVTGFILISINYALPEKVSQRKIAEQIAALPNILEVHIITGDWDLLVKAKARSVQELGKFVIERLRAIPGVAKTLSVIVYETVKEETALEL